MAKGPTGEAAKMSLSRDALLKAKGQADLFPWEKVGLPELGGTVTVRAMSAAERDRFEAEQTARQETDGGMIENFRARLVAKCLIDDDGNRLCSDDDADVLGGLPHHLVKRLFEACLRVNALGAGQVEALAENFGETRGGGGDSE